MECTSYAQTLRRTELSLANKTKQKTNDKIRNKLITTDFSRSSHYFLLYSQLR